MASGSIWCYSTQNSAASPPRKSAMPTPTLKDRFKIALVAYCVLAVAAIVFLALSRSTASLTFAQKLTLSAVSATPIALSVLWEHIKGFKVGGVEFALKEVVAEVSYEIAAAFQELQGSATPELVTAITKAMQQADVKVVAVNLRSSPYWWSTRLYFLSALAEEFTRIERIVFLEKDALRSYIGMASPAAIRKALAANFPDYERVFRDVMRNTTTYPPDPAQQVQNIGFQWPAQTFRVALEAGVAGPAAEQSLLEKDVRKLISPELLLKWLGNCLETESRSWDGSPASRALYAKILTCNAQYVPLLNGRRLEQVVNRIELALKIASAKLA